jgi:hypothetical protein
MYLNLLISVIYVSLSYMQNSFFFLWLQNIFYKSVLSCISIKLVNLHNLGTIQTSDQFISHYLWVILYMVTLKQEQQEHEHYI